MLAVRKIRPEYFNKYTKKKTGTYKYNCLREIESYIKSCKFVRS